MRIGFDVSQAVYGTGVSDYTIELVSALRLADPTNKLVLFGSTLRRTQDMRKLFPEVKSYRFPPTFLHLLWNVLHVVNIENFIGQVDVFHSSDWTQAPASCPKVTTVHDLSPMLMPDEMAGSSFRNISSVHRLRLNWVAKECQKIICVSNSTAKDFQKIFHVEDSKVEIIPEAMPTRFVITPTRDEINSLKKEFDLDDYLVAIGTIQPRKNISRLVKTFLKYQKPLHLPSKLVVIGGQGWGLSDIPIDPRIIFTGYVSDQKLAGLLKGSEAFVFPSLYEGFGLPVLIAFYHQIPVITSNTSSLPEVAGRAAILVDPKSEISIAEGIADALKNRRRLVAEGTKQLSKFSWDSTARKTLSLYSQIC
jgi:glycosyltransferase involved in cell wall biosynthesis